MKLRFAFAGFRHGHIFDVFSALGSHPDAEIVACCEEDAATREGLARAGRVEVTHHDFQEMLREVPCDVIAIGDCYGRRGRLAIAGLQAGKHILSDKPLCTTLRELEEIEQHAGAGQRVVGLQLDSRDYAAFRTLREILRSGEIGSICTIRIDGQHPLLWGTRPAWYFEPGMHGGTINDIGVHAFDFVPWLTGLRWTGGFRARAWNAKAVEAPHFQDCAQMMGCLDNGAGVLADFSYLAPDGLGYKLPHYWRIAVHGTRGVAETHLLSQQVSVVTDASTEVEVRPAVDGRKGGYLQDFISEVGGRSEGVELTSAACLAATRLALQAQASAGAAGGV